MENFVHQRSDDLSVCHEQFLVFDVGEDTIFLMNLKREPDFVEVSRAFHSEAFCFNSLNDSAIAIDIVPDDPAVKLNLKKGASVQQLSAAITLLPSRWKDDSVRVIRHRVAPRRLDHHARLLSPSHVFNGTP